MQSKFLQINKWGSPLQQGVLSLETEYVDVGKLGPDEFIVKIKYACIHPADTMMIEGVYMFSYNISNNILPSKVGLEGVGEIIQVGSNVKDYKVGQKVIPIFENQDSCWQQFVVVKNAFRVPQNLPDEVAAQSYLNPYTAIGLMDDLGLMKDKKDGWLVQNGANSTVGKLVHNLAKQKGIKSIALVRKADSVQMMKENGADKVLVVGNINSADHYAKAILDATDGDGVQYAIDCVGGDIAGPGLYKAMSKNSRYDVYGYLTGKMFIASELPNPQNVKYNLFTYKSWTANHSQQFLQSYLNEFLQYYFEGKISLPVEKIFSLDDFRAALYLQTNSDKSRTGKALFKMF